MQGEWVGEVVRQKYVDVWLAPATNMAPNAFSKLYWNGSIIKNIVSVMARDCKDGTKDEWRKQERDLYSQKFEGGWQREKILQKQEAEDKGGLGEVREWKVLQGSTWCIGKVCTCTWPTFVILLVNAYD